MSSYFYLGSSLPCLSIDSGMSYSSEDYLEICSRMLSKNDFDYLKDLDISDPAALPEFGVAGDYRIWEMCLRNQLVSLRAKEQNREAHPFLRGEHLLQSGAVTAAREAFKKDSPYEAEMLISQFRWDYLEELKSGEMFNIAFIAAYYLQIQLKERLSLFDTETGFANYKKLYDSILEDTDFEISMGENR